MLVITFLVAVTSHAFMLRDALLRDNLVGVSDMVFHLAYFNDYITTIQAITVGDVAPSALYPHGAMQFYAEPYLGQGVLYTLIHFITGRDILSYNLLHVLLFSLNAVGAAYFFFVVLNNRLVAGVLGLAFSLSPFVLGQMEMLNGCSYTFFFPVLATYVQYLRSSRKRQLYWSALFAGMQFYFSAYITFYVGMIILLLYIHRSLRRRSPYDPLNHLIALSLCVAFSLPLLLALKKFAWNSDSVNLVTQGDITAYSLKLAEFGNTAPNNIIYPETVFTSTDSDRVSKVSNIAFPGISLIFFAILGTMRPHRYRWMALALTLIPLALAFGPYINVSGYVLRTPIWFFYEHLNLADILRIPSRIYGLTVIGMLFLAGISICNLKQNLVKQIAGFFLFLYVIENFSWDMEQNQTMNSIIKDYDQMKHAFADTHGEVLTLHLPSSVFNKTTYSDFGLSGFNREYIYAYWQSKYRRNSINGMCGYCPKERLELNQVLGQTLSNSQLDSILDTLNISHVIFDKRMILSETDRRLWESVRSNKRFDLITKKGAQHIFIVNPVN